jgi:glycosyltransferase involved in cell wall biosynthesis
VNVETTPRLSVVIACYNSSETLGDQLEALANQPCPVPWELIVADNGSTDGSAALARSFAGRLPLRVVDASTRRGPAHARNVGVDAAHGAWIAFCDADDVVAPDWLARVCAAMSRHAFVAGRVDVQLLNPPSLWLSRAMEQQEGLQPASGNRLGLPHAGAGNMAIHREVFRRVGGFDEGLRCLEDTDLCWRVQLAGTPLVFDRDLLLHTRLRSTLRGNFAQGRSYARGQSGLERRYGPLTPGTCARAGQHSDSRSAKLAAAFRGVFESHNVRGLAWRLGWYVERAHAVEVGNVGLGVTEPPYTTEQFT